MNCLSSKMAAVAMVIVACSDAAYAQAYYAQKPRDREALKGTDVGVRACVRAGLDEGTVVLEHPNEVTPEGKLLPPPRPGLPTALYSFDDASRLLPYIDRTVEVHGRIKDIRDATIDVKPARNGEPIADLPNEGPDVKATLDEVPLPVGTSGKGSFKTVVLRMDVQSVTQVSPTCATR